MCGAYKKAGKADWNNSRDICTVLYSFILQMPLLYPWKLLVSSVLSQELWSHVLHQHEGVRCPSKHKALRQAGKWGHQPLLLLLLGGCGAGLTHLCPAKSVRDPELVPGLAYAPGLPHMNNPMLCRLAHGLRWTAKISVYFGGVWQKHLIAPTVYFSAELFNAYVTEYKAWFASCGS